MAKEQESLSLNPSLPASMENRKATPKGLRPVLSPSFIYKRTTTLVRHPIFAVLTVVGNGTILAAATTLYILERSVNPDIKSYLDTVWWAVATVTTVGLSDVIPATTVGKFIGMLLMIFGSALFCSFTALFASILLGPEIEDFERGVHEIELSVRRLEKEILTDEQAIAKATEDLEAALLSLQRLKSKKKS